MMSCSPSIKPLCTHQPIRACVGDLHGKAILSVSALYTVPCTESFPKMYCVCSVGYGTMVVSTSIAMCPGNTSGLSRTVISTESALLQVHCTCTVL